MAITANPAKATTANITFALTPGAPKLYQLGYAAFVNGLSGDGSTAVGDYGGRGGPVFQWTAKSGLVSMNVASPGGTVSISRNGRYISTNLLDVNSDTDLGAYRWDAKNGWVRVTPRGMCGTDTNSNFAVSNDGSVFGFTYNTCTDYKAFRWIPNTAIGSIEFRSSFKHSDGTWANSRVDQVSADGSVAVGWQEADWGGWFGSIWHNGQPELVTDVNGDSVSEAFTVSGDGSTVAGQVFEGQYPYDGSGWRRSTAPGSSLEYFPGFPGVSVTNPYAMNSDGKVMVGYSGNMWFDFVYTGPFLWTPQLGTVPLDDFVKHQGTPTEQWTSLYSPSAVSDDGGTIAGVGLGYQYYGGWVLDMHKVFVCHASPEASRKPSALHSPRPSISIWPMGTPRDVANNLDVLTFPPGAAVARSPTCCRRYLFNVERMRIWSLRRCRDCCHPHDHALHVLIALGVLDLALIAVDLVVDGATDHPVGGVDLLVFVGTAGVVILGSRKREIELLFLMLLVGRAGRLHILQRRASRFLVGREGQNRQKKGDHNYSECLPHGPYLQKSHWN